MDNEAKRIAEGLTEAQRQYILYGPYPHWTPTRKALARRLLVKADGALGTKGLRVRTYLEQKQ